MNVNGSLYHLLLGEADWSGCHVVSGEERNLLGDIWDDPLTVEQRSFVPEWREEHAAIGIARLPQDLPATLGENPVLITDRRSVTADRHGNIYVISDDRMGVTVQSAGTRQVSPFWPDPRGAAPAADTVFEDCEPAEPEAPFSVVEALCRDYLLAARDDGTLLRFDLVGGGGPEVFTFVDPVGLSIQAISASPDGGALLLDGAAKRLYRINADIRLCAEDEGTSEASLFQPEDGGQAHETVQHSPWFADLSSLVEPIALAYLDKGHALVLDHREGANCGLYLVQSDTGTVSLLLDCSFDALGMILLPAEAMEAQSEDKPTRTALFWSHSGNQAHAVILQLDDAVWEAGEDPDLRPLRRFGGRGFVSAGGLTYYDSGDPMRWVGLGIKHRCRFAEKTVFETPVFDSGLYQCQWDRIRLDARIPGGCTIRIEARTFDDETLFAIDPEAGWIEQPIPYANGDRAELPALSLLRIAEQDLAPQQCWDVLLQKLKGRHAQLRITLEGDGRQSPLITALRLWYPRFSYSSRFLPQVYSEDPVSGDFIERFLAITEGVNTPLEERIAAARLLFDPRTAPAEALDWLADWFDVALDPVWDDRRRRLFITHAAKFFGWRGTLPGLQLALALAFDENIDACDFDLPGVPQTGLSGIRIVEHFRTRKSARPFGSTTLSSGIHAVIDEEALWHPAEGKQGLIERWAWARGLDNAPPEERTAAFSLVAEDYDNPRDWSAFVQVQIGFVPSLGRNEQTRWHGFLQARGHAGDLPHLPRSAAEAASQDWQDYTAQSIRNRELWRELLSERYGTIARLNANWSTDWLAFSDIPLPDQLPDREASIRDWLDLEGALAPIHRSAHRFSVLIPRRSTAFDPEAEDAALSLASRIIALEKPAHAVFDVRLFWAMNRVGEARLGRDTEIGDGSRAPQLIPPSMLGRSVIGASFAGGPQGAPDGRERLAC
ncbi:phage tail protein [Erythrobacter litoralis]|uniref:NHL repeat domain protein n=1 Tax=Erythrobacter litoralis (strain HTCC2594) TaxID=314225 RepID=Q2N8N1_ERYLH|nr:phage tail protein [Erythrobacter litoralis]ABC63960.1 NHL repeat domain protein [Erythrobacter litoralis HTCC2594]